MNFTLSEQNIKEADDTIVVFAHEGVAVNHADVSQDAAADFKGKDSQITLVYPNSNKQKRIFLVGIGKKEKFYLNKLRNAVAGSVNYARQLETEKLHFPSSVEGISEEEAVAAIAEAAFLAYHKFDSFKSEKIIPKLSEIIIHSKKNLQKQLDYALIAAGNCASARDLVNMPASIATPAFIADKALEISKQNNVKCTVYGRKQLQEMQANALLAVASGSLNEPRMVVLEYNPNNAKKAVALVGKGITFDSGGLNVKPASGMETMKGDMGGAAAVLYAVIAASQLKLPVRVIGVMALTENMIGPNSYKPGDIIKTMSGKTIEILNTDAEGRVVLADALYFASKLNPDYTIDVATLTGACFVALGNEASGLMGNDSFLIEALKKSGDATYERVWEFPMYDEYADLIISDFADVKNVTSNSPVPSGAGTITAAKFLENFVAGKWAHIDIAGTDWSDADKGYKPKGATGVGVRLLVDFLSNL